MRRIDLLARLCLRNSLRNAMGGEELFQELENAADLLLRNPRESEDLGESARNRTLATGDEDAPGNDCCLRLILQRFIVMDELEERLCGRRHMLGDANDVAERSNLSVCGEENAVDFGSAGPFVGSLELR